MAFVWTDQLADMVMLRQSPSHPWPTSILESWRRTPTAYRITDDVDPMLFAAGLAGLEEDAVDIVGESCPCGVRLGKIESA